MTEITFGKPVQLGDGESETAIYCDGDEIGYILKETVPNPKFGRMAEYYREYVAGSYEVVWFVELDDKLFDVTEYASPRAALATAKRYAKESLSR